MEVYLMFEEWLASRKIAVIGLGYVGLPLAVEFSKKYPVIGFDTDHRRIKDLRQGHDRTGEVTPAELKDAGALDFTSDAADLTGANVYIVTVPTPVDVNKKPDLTPLLSASLAIGPYLSQGDVVIYESTVYPGCTEEDCVPVLARKSGLVYGKGFFAGYSPERINPGDRDRRLVDIVKVVSGSDPEIGQKLQALYGSIIRAGTHLAPDIKTAEAAKVIENTQRDLNIALVNELSLIFDRMGIDTSSVLDAACTKWNFLNFRPGLVGGHCIGIDPYYLTFKAQALGYNPEVILAGRRINDAMGREAALRLVKALAARGTGSFGAKVLILGLTFKENCPDLRNTRVIDVAAELAEFGVEVEVWDPRCEPAEAASLYDIDPTKPDQQGFDAVLLAVPHREFLEMGSVALRQLGKEGSLFFDLKGAFPLGESDLRL